VSTTHKTRWKILGAINMVAAVSRARATATRPSAITLGGRSPALVTSDRPDSITSWHVDDSRLACGHNRDVDFKRPSRDTNRRRAPLGSMSRLEPVSLLSFPIPFMRPNASGV
jgi:hypothetical protein